MTRKSQIWREDQTIVFRREKVFCHQASIRDEVQVLCPI